MSRPRDIRALITRTAPAVLAIGAGAVGGCVRDPDPTMRTQPKYQTFEGTDFFPDGASARHLVAGTVTREPDPNELEGNPAAQQPPLSAQLLQRGRERFDIYCAVCHGRDGYGDGMVVQRSYPAPPSYHIDRLRTAPDDHLFRVITDGLGKMPPMAPRVRPADRWAIIAYIRALQLSQSATLDQVPPEQRPQLDQQGPVAAAPGSELRR